MLENYKQEIEVLITWYGKAKEVSIQAESMDCLNKGYVQPMNEQRYSLDHLIRAINYEEEKQTDEIIKKAILSAIGHLQRSYSDSVEWMLVSVKEEYHRILEGFSNEQIKNGFPEYYTDVRPEIERITLAVNQYKNNKSIERASSPSVLSDEQIKMLDDIANQFLSEDMVEKLTKYISLLHERENVLLEIKQKDKKEALKFNVVLPIVTCIIGTIIGSIIVAFIIK